LRRELSDFDPALHTPDACTRLAEQLARTANACSAAAARASLRAAVSPEFLARATGSTPRAARAAMAAVSSLDEVPATQEAVLSGEVSLAQAAAIASVPEHEHELLSMARAGDLGAVKTAARQHVLRTMPAEDLHAKQHEAQYARHWTNDLGNTCVGVELPPEIGVPWVNRFDREVDRAWRTAPRDGRRLSRERVAADVFVRMTSGDVAKQAVKADVVFVVDLDAYRRGHVHDGEVCHVIGGGPIPVEIVREMVKDAFVKAVVHDGVQIHTVKHFGRYRKAELQTALDLGAAPRFEGAVCEEAGCNRRYHLQWDHKDPVANGGPTARDNLQGLCGHHHTNKTERDRKAGKLKRKKRGPPPSRAT
jgi:5-methylcytosine-specific restriction endonuclease McrA